MQTELAVLGGGPGGYAAAFLAADLGMEVTLVEARPELGGVCLQEGCIPSKALLHVAKAIGEAQEMSAWGVKFARPAIDLDQMRQRKDKGIATLVGGLRHLASRRKVRVVEAQGRFESSSKLKLEGGDPATRDDDRLEFDRLILATGSRPSIPKVFDIGSPRVMDSRTALELKDIPESLLVIGGGYIGLEMGSVYARLGSNVTIVEMLESLLGGADRDLVKPLQERLFTLCDSIRLGTKVESIAETNEGIEVQLDCDGKKDRLVVDRVLVAIGRRPNSDDLGLEHTQVEVDDRGFVVVDRQQRTSDPKILAIGDVAGEPMLAHKAFHEGYVAAEVAHGGSSAFDKRAIPGVVFTDPEVAWAGLTEREARERGISVDVAKYPWAANGRAQILGRPEGLTKLLFDPVTERLLGAGIVGPSAGDMIAEAVVAMEMGCTARDIAESIHPHPTFGETFAGAAEVQLGVATEVYRPKRKR